MKICPVNFSNLKIYNKNYSTPLVKPVSSDLITFKSRILSDDELKDYFKTSDLLIKEAGTFQKIAQAQIPFANQMLDVAKNYNDEALIFLDLIKSNPAKNPLNLEDGRLLSYKLCFEDNSCYLDIELIDKENKTSKRIRTQNDKIKSIFFKDSFGIESLFQYGSDNISYMFDVKKNDDTLKAKFCYTYIDDELASIRENVVFTNWIQRCDSFSYFKNDRLLLMSKKSFSTLPDNTTRDEKRYTFDKNGNLLNFIYDYSRSTKGRLSHRDGMHFKDGKFFAWTHKTLQPVLNKPLEMEDCVYLKDGKYIQSKDVCCIYDDFSQIEII